MVTSIKSNNEGYKVKENENKIILEGIPASPGTAKGRVKVVTTFTENIKFNNGDILVTRETNPLYTTLILKSAAIITDLGGLLSHAAIISREMGIPCVTSTERATQILKDDIEVTVNGTNGKVYTKC
jgi:pyruvate,water dikinase